ncbi:discoidin domain-containing protein, partial [Blautia hydrogenotrophica]|uniref:discoidin domain-containing protein n=1 Tax=Blautia hydrogenotrophica TaxID=53443 RepID=UPI003AB78FAF
MQKGSFEPGTVYRYVLVKLTDFPAEDYWPGFAEFKLYARDYSELDKSELTKLISEVKYMKPGNYTDESYANLRTVFEQAKKDFEEADTKEKVSAAIEKLQEAIDALKIKEGANLALGKPTKSSTQNVDERPSSNGNDGDESTLWVATGNYEDTPLPHWWQVDLEKEYVLDKYRIVFEDDKNPGAWKYRIEGSKDGENFDVLFEQKSSPDGTREDEQKIQSKESYRYVRVVITDYPEWEGADYWTAFAEFEVYGSKAGSEVVTKNLEIKLAEAKAYTEEKYTEESYKAL